MKVIKISDCPILEFDPDKNAIINPHEHIKPIASAKYCVICFSKEIIEKISKEHSVKVIHTLKSIREDHPVYQIKYKGKKVSFFLSGIGAPLAAGLFEEIIALGFTKIIAWGSAGVLNKEIQRGKLVIPTSAIRDEGVSYHYIPPSREVIANPAVVKKISKILNFRGIDYIAGKTWTTDAFYRETKNKIARRKKEGCLTVEMEAAAFFAVAQFRNVRFGQILYGADDVSGDTWDRREYENRRITIEQIFYLAMDICTTL
ncbi:MAG: nucleoside phosphorylase [bacterium]|nr:nucleoside phosphorylase [bacterium]